jgi:hypothetical protein
MIIQINATVCGDMAMVKDWQFMIIWSDGREAGPPGQESGLSCG